MGVTGKMSPSCIRYLAFLLSVCSLLVASRARAEGDTERERRQEAARRIREAADAERKHDRVSGIKIAALTGAGLGSEVKVGEATASTPYGFGAGGRLGYTMPSGMYLGGLVMAHLGSDGGVITNDVGVFRGKASGTLVGVESGFEWGAGPVILRGYAGLGMFLEKHARSCDRPDSQGRCSFEPASDSATYGVLWPGFGVELPIGQRFFIGLDLKLLMKLKASSPAASGMAELGVRF
jgi:hypothetical protein